MAFKDALFQLGMDLTRSSTAQKEDHGETARPLARVVVPKSEIVVQSHGNAVQSHGNAVQSHGAEVGRFKDRVVPASPGAILS